MFEIGITLLVFGIAIMFFLLVRTLIPHIHFHRHETPICSKYIAFNARDIIYECGCGHRKVKRINAGFSDGFPIETSLFLTDEQFNMILNREV